jgi:hypothetical protein
MSVIESIKITDIDLISEKSLDYLIMLYESDFIIDRNIKPTFQHAPHPTINGFFDEYKFDISAIRQKEPITFSFINRVTYFVINDFLNHRQKYINNKDIIKKLNQTPNNFITTFKFIDSKSRLSLTGDLGYYSKYVMDFVISSTKESIERNKKNLIGFYYTVDNKELKRVKFYDMIISKILNMNNRMINEGVKSTEIYYFW